MAQLKEVAQVSLQDCKWVLIGPAYVDPDGVTHIQGAPLDSDVTFVRGPRMDLAVRGTPAVVKEQLGL